MRSAMINSLLSRRLALVVQRLDNAIHRINHYPVDKCEQNKPRYPLNSDLSGGLRYPAFEQPGLDIENYLSNLISTKNMNSSLFSGLLFCYEFIQTSYINLCRPYF